MCNQHGSNYDIVELFPSYALWLVPLGSVHWKEEVAVEPHMEEQLLLGLTPHRAVGAGVPVDLAYT